MACDLQLPQLHLWQKSTFQRTQLLQLLSRPQLHLQMMRR
jgi:hypothetical protein